MADVLGLSSSAFQSSPHVIILQHRRFLPVLKESRDLYKAPHPRIL